MTSRILDLRLGSIDAARQGRTGHRGGPEWRGAVRSADRWEPAGA